METKLKVFFSIVMLWTAVYPCCCQEVYQCEPITKPSQIVDGGTYMFYHPTATNQWYFERENCTAEGKEYKYRLAIKYGKATKMDDIIRHNFLFKFLKIKNNWYMVDAKSNLFIGHEASWFIESETPDQDYIVHFAEKEKNPCAVIFGKYAVTIASSWVSLSTSPDKKINCPDLYQVTNCGMIADEDQDLQMPSVTCTSATLTRKFAESVFNTLILPYDVPNYKVTFGWNTTAYELVEANATALYYEEKNTDLALKANTPYLIKGHFFTGNYITPIQVSDDMGTNEITKTIGPVTIHGIYEKKDIGRSDAFILYQDILRCCQKVKNMPVKPYHWYITIPGGAAQAKSIRMIDKTTATGMASPIVTENPNGPIYHIQGTPMNMPWDALPKGIYIVNHKKVIKP